MAIDLLDEKEYGRGAAYLVARLCEEAGVCMGHQYISIGQEGNQTLLEAATWEVSQGLRVTDEDGKQWRIYVSVGPAPPPSEDVPPDLEEMARQTERLRHSFLFGGKDQGPFEEDGVDPLAVQEVLSALAYLELAQRALCRAALHQARGVAPKE